MKTTVPAFALFLLAFNAFAQGDPKRSDDYNEGYRRGFKDGFREGSLEADKRGAVAAPAPIKATGPITITSAYYGTSSKNCNAAHWLGKRVNGKRSASVQVENSICGDPAPGARKSLEVTYICGALVKTESAFEHRTASFDCTY
ncbi:hypothetical protein [Usitatibacter palustris]|uniref:Secreted protein n=1 Tax=Usitatibacter palustris TaxID=2732487 RepID=A0A6M4H6Q9_9PROT|nr:hypothetical protein [Usitatibacter palustris]QJR14343.1 hypothetical protein DSM104440_01139 [Usitatibacter palustris]